MKSEAPLGDLESGFLGEPALLPPREILSPPGPFYLHTLVQCKRRPFWALSSFTGKWSSSSPRIKCQEMLVGLLRREKSHLSNGAGPGDRGASSPSLKNQEPLRPENQKAAN